ncbi:MAG: UvrB/UvrC motif-containing protein [Patescibacteria group bacterium]|nr:UvrB/UvrC motif-containing protein [Patescibacteria group bacterium]
MEKFKYLGKDKITQLPKSSGVYAFKGRDREILYIGKAANIRERVKNHFQKLTYKDNLFIDQVSKIGYLKTDSEIEALILEANLIKKYQPKYNVIWRDDKNYFFVAKTKEDFPRIFITHQPILKTKNLKFKTEYVGPFVDGKALKETLKVLRKVFPYRSCRVLPKRACLWYHLGRCPAPCLLKTKLIEEIPKNTLKIKNICQRNARNLMKIIEKGKNPVLKELKKEMKIASKNQEFEEAARIRDQIEALEKVMAHAKIFEPPIRQITPWCKMYNKIELRLRKMLKVKNKISRIEAYDISNIQGKAATGSMVTFIDGLPDKNFYRKFKIKIAGKPNDIAMLKECLTRRLKHPEWPYPDLILIDGGQAQLNAAILKAKSYKLKAKTMALAKKKNELYIENQKKPILLKTLPREIFNLILQLRDEAHRFALSYHKKLREIDFRSNL